MIIPLLLGFILGAAVIIFALQNTETVALSFLGWQFESSLALLILIALAAGILVSVLVSIPSAVRNGWRVMSLRKENQRLARELEDCRRGAAALVEESSSPQVLDIRGSR